MRSSSHTKWKRQRDYRLTNSVNGSRIFLHESLLQCNTNQPNDQPKKKLDTLIRLTTDTHTHTHTLTHTKQLSTISTVLMQIQWSMYFPTIHQLNDYLYGEFGRLFLAWSSSSSFTKYLRVQKKRPRGKEKKKKTFAKIGKV